MERLSTSLERKTMERNTTIDFQFLAKIIINLDKTFSEEDQDFPDGRKMKIYERSIDHWLSKLNADKEMERDIYETHCPLDQTFEKQCDRLRAKGYTIINNKKG